MNNLIKHIPILDRPPSFDQLPPFTVFNITLSDNASLKNIHCTDKKDIN